MPHDYIFRRYQKGNVSLIVSIFYITLCLSTSFVIHIIHNFNVASSRFTSDKKSISWNLWWQDMKWESLFYFIRNLEQNTVTRIFCSSLISGGSFLIMQMNDPFNNSTHPKGKVISTIFFADKQGTPHATHKLYW